MTEYYKVIEDYLTRWPTEDEFMKAHENYRVEGIWNSVGGTSNTSKWVLGKDYMEGDVIFTFFNNESGKRPPLKLEGILYLIDENDYGFRHLSNKTYSDLSKEKQKMKKAQWTLNRGWGNSDSRSSLKLQIERAGVEVAVDPERLKAALVKDPEL